MSAFDHLETPLDAAPLFPVEAPDGRKELSELERAKLFRSYVAKLAPKVVLYANANAGKRNPTQARAEGIKAGVPDYTIAWDIADSTIPDCAVSVAWIELKGYSADGRPGKLSKAQIDFMNGLHSRGHKVACFFFGKISVRLARFPRRPGARAGDMIGAFKRWLLAREIDRALKQRRIIRKARSQAAQRGVTTYWKRAAMQARATFNGGANA